MKLGPGSVPVALAAPKKALAPMKFGVGGAGKAPSAVNMGLAPPLEPPFAPALSMNIFVPGRMLRAKVKLWLEEHMPAKDVPGSKKLKGHDEVLARLLQATPPKEILKAAGTERLLANLTPRQILRAAGTERLLAGVPPEERLADLPPEQQLLAMPDSALAALSREYVRTLPASVQAAIRKRIRAVK